ncbi:MAG: hypothetical protein ACPG5Z_00325 [Pseudoalteromonas sp.]
MNEKALKQIQASLPKGSEIKKMFLYDREAYGKKSARAIVEYVWNGQDYRTDLSTMSDGKWKQ